MSLSESVEFLVAINLVVIGLSHFFQPKIWVDYFEYLHELKNAGNVINALMTLGFGSFVLSFHFIWEWPVILVTIYGLLLTLKGFIYLIFPSVGLSTIGTVNHENAHRFRWAGVLMVIFAIGIIYGLIQIKAF